MKLIDVIFIKFEGIFHNIPIRMFRIRDYNLSSMINGIRFSIFKKVYVDKFTRSSLIVF